MAYCTQLWIDNLIGVIGGPNPTRVVRDHNTVLTVQNPEVPVKGWPHLSYHRYPLLLLTILLNEKVADKGLYRKHTIMLGIERGQREEEKPIHTDEEYKVSERSKRCMRGLYALTVLGLGIEESRHKSKMDKSEITVTGARCKLCTDKYSHADGQMICIRLEPLRRLWAKNDRRNWDQINSYGECSVLKLRVQQLQWQMILYRYQTDKASKENAIKGNLNLLLVVSLMTQLNQNRVHKEFLQHPTRVFEKNEPRLGNGRQLYVKRRWRSVYFRSSWMTGMNRTKFAYQDASWAEQIRRYPWYRFVPLITWLSTWEIGITYLPTSSGKESWRNWPNPELNESIDITGNDKVWKDWSRKCGILMKERGHEFYEDQDIDNWWSHLQTINKREVLKWLLYDRPNYRIMATVNRGMELLFREDTWIKEL